MSLSVFKAVPAANIIKASSFGKVVRKGIIYKDLSKTFDVTHPHCCVGFMDIGYVSCFDPLSVLHHL